MHSATDDEQSHCYTSVQNLKVYYRCVQNLKLYYRCVQNLKLYYRCVQNLKLYYRCVQNLKLYYRCVQNLKLYYRCVQNLKLYYRCVQNLKLYYKCVQNLKHYYSSVQNLKLYYRFAFFVVIRLSILNESLTGYIYSVFCSQSTWMSSPTVVRMWRQVNTRLVELYQYMHLIFGTATYTPAPPSDHVRRTAEALFDLLKIRKLQGDEKYEPSESSESESELIFAEELLGGIVGNKKDHSVCKKKKEEEKMEQEEAEAWRRAKSLLQECAELETLLQVCIHFGKAYF